VSPDGNRVFYWAVQDTENVAELYAAMVDGTGNVKLNGPLPEGEDVQPDFVVSPDGSRVVYRAAQDTADREELYSTNVDGSGNVKLNAPLSSAVVRVTGFVVP